VSAYIGELRSLDWHRYPDRGASALRVAIAQWHGCKPGQVFVANGSNEVLQCILLAFAGPGRKVATFEPSYQMHGQIARVVGSEVVGCVRGNDFALDVQAACSLIATEKPSVTFICSPNNPTGLVEPRANVERLLAAVDAVGGLLVVDEAYAQFSPWSALDLIADDTPVVVTRTFSKTWSMAAARLGYVIAPAWLVDELDKVVLPYHLDAAKQIAGVVALRFVDEMVDRVASIVDERARLCAGLEALGVRYVPSGANFVLFEVGDARGVWQRLVDRGVLVRDCSGWPHLAGHLRVTVGTPAENDHFLAALAESVPADTQAQETT
jgi:histidinol-phosphate aminotransferase